MPVITSSDISYRHHYGRYHPLTAVPSLSIRIEKLATNQEISFSCVGQLRHLTASLLECEVRSGPPAGVRSVGDLVMFNSSDHAATSPGLSPAIYSVACFSAAVSSSVAVPRFGS